MTEDVSDNTTNASSGEESGHGHHRLHRHHSSGRHHKHSRQVKTVLEEPHKEGRHKIRIEQNHREDRWRKTESTLIKHFLKIMGAIFLLNGIWFIADSSEKFRYFVSFVANAFQNVGKNIETSGSSPDLTTGFDVMLILYIVISVLILLLFLFSVRKRNIELEVISFVSWILLALWWVVKFVSAYNSYIISGYLIASTIFFLVFFLANISNVYPIRRKWAWQIESALIFTNLLFYFFSGIFAMKILGWRRVTVVFAILLIVGNFLPIYNAVKKRHHFNSVPYMISTALIACFILPMLFKINFGILYLVPLSVFFLLISKATRNQASILFSIGAMLVVIMIYLFQWIFDYFPGCFINNILLDNELFDKGLIAGLVIIPAFIINNILLKKLTITFSAKLFSKSTYRKILKGVILGVIYLTGFWVFNYLVQYLLDIDGLSYLILFAFNCLYFIVLIPYLEKTGSSFLRIMLIIGVVLSFLYPSLIDSYNLKFRDFFVRDGFPLISGFGFHYLNMVLLLVMLFVMMKYKTRAFARKKNYIRGFWVYFFMMIAFVVITEFHHLMFFYSWSKGGYVLDVLEKTLNLYDSILLITCTIIFLIIGFIRRFRFLRIFSLLVFACVLIKILALDIYFLENNAREVVFIILGTLAFGLSIFYSKFKKYFFKSEARSAESKKKEEIKTSE